MGTAAPPLNNTALAQILGRNQGPELFFQQPFTALSSPIIPKNINLNRPLETFHIVWRGRVAIATGNFTTPAAEAPQTIIQRIRITGPHRKYGALTLIDISGATAFAWARMTRQRNSSLYINGTRQPEPSVPFGQTLANFGNIGTYDLEIHYNIPVAPVLPTCSELSVVPFLLQQQDWSDTLQIQLFFGDATSFGTPGTAVTTFSSFGSGAGTPVASIFTNYEILGPLANNVPSGVCIRNEATVSGPVTAIGNNIRLSTLQKQKTTIVLVKSGILLTGSSAGVSVFQTLSDTLLDFTQITVDNKPVRNNFNNFAQKEYAGFVFDTILPQGYLTFPFDDSMNPLTFYRGDLLAGGSNFELDSNVISANANNSVLFLQEQVYGDPQGQ